MLWKAIYSPSQRHVRTHLFNCTFTGTAMSNLPYSEAWLAGPSSTQFYTRTYTPVSLDSTKAAIVFVHGFAEHIGRYTHFHPLLSTRGIAVFTYDQRGFGLTAQDTKGNKSKSSTYGKTCWKDQLADIEWAVEHTRKLFQDKPVFLMGHSMVNFTVTLVLNLVLTFRNFRLGWWRGIRFCYARRKGC
jgi:pimeloyl-ACP methyl ester carboxylesterase